MIFSSKFASVLFASTLVCASAVAQTRFCIGGDLDHLSGSQKAACSATLQTVRNTAAAMHAPEDWHFVLVCGEQGWKDYADYADGGSDRLLTAKANTDLVQHETFFRESTLNGNSTQTMQTIVAHEVARIQLQTKDEVAVQERQARLLASNEVHSGF